jgi:ElaB/YqjD/DUF883 family membrane-anchored ribosome-binding protein
VTNPDDETERTTTPSGRLSAAARQAQHAMDSAKEVVAGADLDQLRAKAADAASAIYREGRDILMSDEVAKARDQLAESIRKNPFAAVGIAFTAGLLLALLTRG